MPPRRVITGRSQEPRKRFAEELRHLRVEHKLTFRALGDALGWDGSLFSKMEKGETLGGPEVIQALETFYGVPGLILALWELALGDPTQFKERYRRYMSLEAEAVSLWYYAVGSMPGLLQTPSYARAQLEVGGLEGDELDSQVQARIGRRELLDGPSAPPFRAILSETVLRTPLADQEQWREQLEHLLTMSERKNITLQVVPHAAGLHALMNTDVIFLRLADGRSVTYVETAHTGDLVQDSAAVQRLQLSYDQTRDLALSPDQTREFITKILKEMPCDPST
ncbi:helix-turn-helix domain protein [Streptomyces laurentii]|uniref:Helix-turn-helix domain protein n=1 Tax=Streptomyces laurentii TaxID=39478 RepID=A0A169NH40_STRLU|nr:helix-turn-helix domain protein [Streptomyces laurentii]